MAQCERCRSFAINHHCHGRDGSDPGLCDVCYWRKRAEAAEAVLRELVALKRLRDGVGANDTDAEDDYERRKPAAWAAARAIALAGQRRVIRCFARDHIDAADEAQLSADFCDLYEAHEQAGPCASACAMAEHGDEPRCDLCGAEITTGLMAVWCQRGEACEFFPRDDEHSAQFIRRMRANADRPATATTEAQG